jgi:magnesium transporter
MTTKTPSGRLAQPSSKVATALMGYPPRTAGSIMTTEFVSVPAELDGRADAGHVRKVERSRETVYAIYVLDPRRRRWLRRVRCVG